MNITDFDATRHPVQSERLAGRTYLVSGAAGAIGSALAIALGRAGASVVLLDRNERGLDVTYDRIEQDDAPQPAKLVLDLATAGVPQYDELAEVIEQEMGRLDGIVHTAFEPGTLTPLDQYPLETWNRALLVNLNAPYLLTRSCLPLLLRAQDATVTFTTSDVARQGKAYWGAYCVTGFALEGLAQVWADELEANTPVRVNTIDPGAVQSHMRSRFYPGETAATIASADSVVPAYLYLLSSAANGLSLRVSAPA
jgi:NAD(P)-dependent dehydrogenase (short-subunit alcohol dehydrogenase family)